MTSGNDMLMGNNLPLGNIVTDSKAAGNKTPKNKVSDKVAEKKMPGGLALSQKTMAKPMKDRGEKLEKDYGKLKTQTDQIRYEFTNRDTIVLRKNGMYHKAMGNSAVILKMMGGKTKIRSHFDTVLKQEVFEMSFHVGKIDEVKVFLKKICEEVLRDDTQFFVVRLNKPVDAKKMRRAKRDWGLKGEIAEDILLRRRRETPLAKEVRDVFKEAGILARGLSGTDGQVLARLILEEIMRLYAAVRLLMRASGDIGQLRIDVDDIADNLQGWLLMIPNFERNADRLARMGRSLNYIRNEIEDEERTDKKRAANKKVLVADVEVD